MSVFLTPSGLPFPKHSRLACLDTLGFDTPCFGYTLDKLTHRVDLPSFTPPSRMEARLNTFKSLLDILNNIVGIFDTNGKTDKVILDSDSLKVG